MDTGNEDEKFLQGLVGLELSAVVFVRDYAQFQFDGPVLTAVTMPSVSSVSGGESFRWDEAGYKDKLCSQIGHRVTKVSVVPDDALRVHFEEVVFHVSLKAADYRGAEAVIYSNENDWLVI